MTGIGQGTSKCACPGRTFSPLKAGFAREVRYGVETRSRFALLLALGAALLLHVSCSGKLLPPDKANYAGEWKAPDMDLLITPAGNVQYKRVRNRATTSVSGPIQAFKGNDFSVGVLFLSTTFAVSRAPYQEDGKWKMVVDGVELTRSNGAQF